MEKCTTKLLFLSLLLPGFAMAQDTQPSPAKDCQPTEVHVRGMGMVDFEHLEEHIKDMEERMEKVRRTEAPSSQHRKLLEEHMEDMVKAMEQLQSGGNTAPCVSAANQPLEERIKSLEQRVDILQKLMKQVIGQEKEIMRR